MHMFVTWDAGMTSILFLANVRSLRRVRDEIWTGTEVMELSLRVRPPRPGWFGRMGREM